MRLSRILTSAAVLGAAACAGAPHAAHRLTPMEEAGVARVRAATDRFASLDSAVAAGYPRDVPQCFRDTINGHGAMGFHHVNRPLIDRNLEIERPEILLYERLPDGRYVFNGVEYIILFRHWPRDSVPPTAFGRPLLQDLDRNYWYVHVWSARRNTMGMFADWNPAVRCPGF